MKGNFYLFGPIFVRVDVAAVVAEHLPFALSVLSVFVAPSH